jgi:hypothetical protein
MPSAIEQANAPTQLHRFVTTYNEERPHQARGCSPMQAQRAPLRSSLLGWSESTLVDHPCLQPPFDESLRRETTQASWPRDSNSMLIIEISSNAVRT